MGALINILYHSIGSMLIGIIITLIGCILMFIIIRSWWKNCEFTPLSFVVGAILFLFLSFQSILLCGAITIKSYSNRVEDHINTLVGNIPEGIKVSTQQSQQILDNISQEWPLIGHYVDVADFYGHTPSTISTAMTNELHSFMNKFILRRLGWSLLFIVIGAFIIIKTISIRYEGERTTRNRMERTPVSRQRTSSRSTRRVSRR